MTDYTDWRDPDDDLTQHPMAGFGESDCDPSVRDCADLRIVHQAQLLPHWLRALPLNVRKRERNCNIALQPSRAALGRPLIPPTSGVDQTRPGQPGCANTRSRCWRNGTSGQGSCAHVKGSIRNCARMARLFAQCLVYVTIQTAAQPRYAIRSTAPSRRPRTGAARSKDKWLICCATETCSGSPDRSGRWQRNI